MQVLTVTHSPQVAACGNSHFKVEKKTADNVTTTYVYELDKTARFEEIARMLAGEHITDEARAAAPGVADGVKAAGRLRCIFGAFPFGHG